jgi:hypothetical protein
MRTIIIVLVLEWDICLFFGIMGAGDMVMGNMSGVGLICRLPGFLILQEYLVEALEAVLMGVEREDTDREGQEND